MPQASNYLSLGNIISANITRKNPNVCRKKPAAVGQPPADAMSKNFPNIICVNLNVSGLATRKNTRAL